MLNNMQTYTFFALLLTIDSFAQAGSLNDCNTNLIIKKITSKLNTISDYKLNIEVKFDSYNVNSKIIGKIPNKLKITQKIKTTPPHNYIAVFNGKYQWVESKQNNHVQIVKLNISKLTKKNRPYDTGYYLMGTGLLNGEDYIGTLTTLLNTYDFTSTCNDNTIILSGIINANKFKYYALNIKSKTQNIKNIEKYIEKFNKINISVKKGSAGIYGYKFLSDNNNVFFEAVFNNIKLNNKISNSEFLYIPPKGVNVTDITKQLIQSNH